MKMTEGNAREIIKKGKSFRLEKDETVNLGEILERSIRTVQEYAGAERYLERVEQERAKIKKLEEAVGVMRDALRNIGGTNSSICCPECAGYAKEILKMADEILGRE